MLRRILAWGIERVLIAQGAPAEHDGEAFVRLAFDENRCIVILITNHLWGRGAANAQSAAAKCAI